MYIDLKPLIYSLEPVANSGQAPVLAIIKHGENQDSESYIKSIQRKADKLGVSTITVDIVNRFDVTKVLDEVQTKADAVLPIKPLWQLEELIIKTCIDFNKDVDNFSGESKFENCTVEAVNKILNFLDISHDKRVCIIGRHLGLQIALSLLERDFTPTICHSKTSNLKLYTQDADVIISCTGVKNLITKDMVKVNATVIDIGLGDVAEDVIEKADVTSVKDGVGAVTTSVLFKHIFETMQ